MELVFRTIANKVVNMSVEPEELISAVKERLIVEMKDENVTKVTLVCNGRLLKDESKVADCRNLKEQQVVVVVADKKKELRPPRPPPEPAAPPPVPTVTPAPSEGSGNAAAPADTDASPQPPTTANTEAPSSNDRGEPESVESVLIAMGFDESRARKALQLAFGNADRAVEYLVSPTFDDDTSVDIAEEIPTPTSPGGNFPTDEEGEISVNPNSPLYPFYVSGAFEQMRNLVQTQPSILPTLLQRITEQNPQLAQVIAENQDEFLAALGQETALPEGTAVIHLSAEDQDAIHRLQDLGFAAEQCVEAYIACDKNEEVAANFLFENQSDFNQPDPQQ